MPSETVVVFHDAEYGATVISAPKLAPSSLNWTPTTPTLSEAVAEIVVVADTVEPPAGPVIETAGAVVSSTTLLTVTETGADVVWLPAASRATAVRLCTPLLAVAVFQDTVYGDDASSLPRLAPSSLNCTPTTPTLSEAVAVTLKVANIVAPPAGEVIDTVGAVVSALWT